MLLDFFGGRGRSGYRSGFGVDKWEGRFRGLDRGRMDIVLHYLERVPRDEQDEFWQLWQGLEREEQRSARL